MGRGQLAEREGDKDKEHGAKRVGSNREPSQVSFMDLEIWRDVIEIGTILFRLADDLESKRLYKFAEQLRAAGLSMSNNIAEGSGSISKKEFLVF